MHQVKNLKFTFALLEKFEIDCTLIVIWHISDANFILNFSVVENRWSWEFYQARIWKKFELLLEVPGIFGEGYFECKVT